MRVLIACEFSGIAREAFNEAGHSAASVDLLPTEQPDTPKCWHFQSDVNWPLHTNKWDMLIAFPPCTHLCSSGARWWKDKRELQAEAIDFVLMLAGQRIPKIAIENPVGVLSKAWRKPDQIIQPWMFGHGETKATCLWLKGLPLLSPTDIVEGRTARVHRIPPSDSRWKERSRTLPGIARAMAEQWGRQ